MRIGVISDIHGNLPALEAVLADLRPRAPDVVVNLGDLVSGPLWPRETLERLAAPAGPTVRGNHDRWLSEEAPERLNRTNRWVRDQLSAAQLEALGALPARLDLAPGVLAVHGTPASDTEYLLEELVDGRLARVNAAVLAARLAGSGTGVDLVLCGHSHTQHAAAAGGCLVVNPGSVGCPRTADNLAPGDVEAGSPHARYALVTRTRHGWMTELLGVPYDWAPVAERAARNARPDWRDEFLGRPAAAGGAGR